jgi:hypothetical protein
VPTTIYGLEAVEIEPCRNFTPLFATPVSDDTDHTIEFMLETKPAF